MLLKNGGVVVRLNPCCNLPLTALFSCKENCQNGKKTNESYFSYFTYYLSAVLIGITNLSTISYLKACAPTSV